MNSEEFLINLMRSMIKEIEFQLESIKIRPEELKIPGFDDGKIVGLSRALELASVALFLYERKIDEENKK